MKQMWAEVMALFRTNEYPKKFSEGVQEYMLQMQKDFMPEDTKSGMIQGFLDEYKGEKVCSKMLYHEALQHPYDEPKQWELKEINDILRNGIVGWKQGRQARFTKYGQQRSWIRVDTPEPDKDGFVAVSKQIELPFPNV